MVVLICMLLSGVLWSVTYALIIRQGFRDQTYGMPLVALCANISWEFIFAFVLPQRSPQFEVNVVWFLLDAVIFYQVLRFGPRELRSLGKWFLPTFLVTLVMSFSSILFLTYYLNDRAGVYTAFGQNLMMSVLFIVLLLRRGSLRGQSLAIAICKMLGTVFASVGIALSSPLRRESPVLVFLYVSILVFDVMYVVLVAKKVKAAKPEFPEIQRTSNLLTP